MNMTYPSPLGPLSIVIENSHITRLTFVTSGKKTHTISRVPVVLKISHQLNEYFAGERKRFDLPIDLNGTAFHMQVWRYLQTIPYGHTVSYQSVARAIGHPRASRAVGSACKSNPIPILIPCHRVIRSDGNLGQYGGGAQKKRWLVDFEGQT